MIKRMGMEYITGKMDEGMKDGGARENSMG